MKERKKNFGKDNLIALSVLVVVTLLLCIPYTNKYFIGVFGYAVYPYMIGAYALLFCSAKKMKMRVSKRKAVMYSITVFTLILTLHIGLAKELISEGWTGYITGVFNSPTVGGMVFSLLSCFFVIPMGYLSSLIISFIVFSILLFVVIYPILTVKPVENKGKKDVIGTKTEIEPTKRLTVEKLQPEPLPVEEEEIDKRSAREKARDILFIKPQQSQTPTETIEPLYGTRKIDLLDRVEKQKVPSYKTEDLLGGEIGILVHPSDSSYYVSPRDRGQSRKILYTDPISDKKSENVPPAHPSRVAPPSLQESEVFPIKKYNPEKEQTTEALGNTSASSATEKPFIPLPKTDLDRKAEDFSVPSVKETENPREVLFEKKVEPKAENETKSDVTGISMASAFKELPLPKEIGSKNRIAQAIEALSSQQKAPANKEIPPEAKLDKVEKKPLQTPKESVISETNTVVSVSEEPKKEPEERPKRPYIKPYPGLLDARPITGHPGMIENYAEIKSSIEKRMANFNITVDVYKAVRGPRITRYFLKLGEGVPVKKAVSYIDDLKMAIKSQNGAIDIHAPIAGQDAFGIDVPNLVFDDVGFKEVFESPEFSSKEKGLYVALGRTVDGQVKVVNIEDMPHLLIAGSTGGGKSVCSNVFIMSLIMNCTPDEVRLILIDPKKVELTFYEGIPHMLVPKPLVERNEIINALRWVREETNRRYDLLTLKSVKKLSDYNKLAKEQGYETLPRILVVIDEASELMLNYKKEVENTLSSLASIGRAAGIHLIFATQSPSREIITGAILNNINTRIACRVADYTHSMLILRKSGAQNLIGNGDLYLLLPGGEMERIQCCYVSDNEIKRVTKFLRENNDCYYNPEIVREIYKKEPTPEDINVIEAEKPNGAKNVKLSDDRIKDALKVIISSKKATISFIQRRLKLGFNAASDVMEELERLGFISPPSENSAKQREIYITKEQFAEMYPDDAIKFLDDDTDDD